MELNAEARNLASLVTFRQLYDDGRSDIYSIISKFVENIIETSKLYSFGIIEISEAIRLQYGFKIPDYVVQTSVKRLGYVTKADNKYTVDAIKIQNTKFVQKYDYAIVENENLVSALICYAESKKGELTLSERKVLVKDFCSFLLDETNGNSYSDVISAFIFENSFTELNSQIRLIKEGAVLFAGINYNSNVSEKSAWKNDINIFVENEILFHLAGYNGEIFQRIAIDLFTLIAEMNTKSKKRVINVKYFKEVESEIEDFFLKAQDIVAGKDIVSVSNYAMNTIVKGCHSASDVLMKKTSFMRVLSKYGIQKEIDHDYYNEINHKFNLESPECITRYQISDDKIRYIKHINYVNILRGGKNENDLKCAGYIVLTETGKMLRMAKEMCTDGIPNVINMNMLTNRLWYDLNKGFGAKEFPSSFDVLIKSQIVLSSLLSQSVSEKYEKARKDYALKKISTEELADAVIMLREAAKRPEDITSNNIAKVLEFISEETVEIYQSEKEKLSNDLQEKNEEIKQIHKVMTYQNEKLKEKEERLGEERTEQIQLLKMTLNDKVDHSDREKKRKRKADEIIQKKRKRFRSFEVSAIVVYYGALVFLLLWLPESNKNILLGLCTLLPPVVWIVVSIILNKSMNPFEMISVFDKLYEKHITEKTYVQYDIDVNKIESLDSEIEQLVKMEKEICNYA